MNTEEPELWGEDAPANDEHARMCVIGSGLHETRTHGQRCGRRPPSHLARAPHFSLLLLRRCPRIGAIPTCRLAPRPGRSSGTEWQPPSTARSTQNTAPNMTTRKTPHGRSNYQLRSLNKNSGSQVFLLMNIPKTARSCTASPRIPCRALQGPPPAGFSGRHRPTRCTYPLPMSTVKSAGSLSSADST